MYSDDLASYYRMMAILNENHHITYEEYENMIPYERDIMMSLINDMNEMKKSQQQQ
jgi:hypothetical protein